MIFTLVPARYVSAIGPFGILGLVFLVLLLLPIALLVCGWIRSQNLPRVAEKRYGGHCRVRLGEEDHQLPNEDAIMRILTVNGERPIGTAEVCYLPLGQVRVIGMVKIYDPYGTVSDILLADNSFRAKSRAQTRQIRKMEQARRALLSGELPGECIVMEFTVERGTSYRMRPDPETGEIILVWERGEEHGTRKFCIETERAAREYREQWE